MKPDNRRILVIEMKTRVFTHVLFLLFFAQCCEPKGSGVAVSFSEEVICKEIDTAFFEEPLKKEESLKKRSKATTRLPKEVTFEQIDTLFIGLPLTMSICGDDLFITDNYEPMIVHYNLKDRKTDKFLSKGRGPGEAQPPVILFANPFGDNKLYRHSKQTREIGYYLLDSLSAFVPLLKLPPEISDVIPYENGRYLGAGIFKDEYRYKVLNEEGTVVDRFGDYPDFLAGENTIPFNARSMFHQVKFVNSYRINKLVAKSSYVVDIIDYSVDITKNSIKRILLAPYDYEYDTGVGRGTWTWAQERRGMIIGATSVACDARYIYLLFDHGLVREENKSVKKEIWVFDWEGRPIKKLRLDMDMRKITADPFSDAHVVYGLAYESNGSDEYYIILKINI